MKHAKGGRTKVGIAGTAATVWDKATLVPCWSALWCQNCPKTRDKTTHPSLLTKQRPLTPATQQKYVKRQTHESSIDEMHVVPHPCSSRLYPSYNIPLLCQNMYKITLPTRSKAIPSRRFQLCHVQHNRICLYSVKMGNRSCGVRNLLAAPRTNVMFLSLTRVRNGGWVFRARLKDIKGVLCLF